MSLSTCSWCGGNIPLGDPNVAPCCEKCGKHLFSEPPPPSRTHGHVLRWLSRFAMLGMLGYIGFRDWQLGLIAGCVASVAYMSGGLDIIRWRNRP